MKYNFDEIVDRRGSNCIKWDPETLMDMFGEKEALPFWVADMDFRVAQPITEAISGSVDHGIYGYSKRPDSYYNAIIHWTERRFKWKIKKEWIVYTPGIVSAINQMIQAFCIPGDKILLQQPAYYQFTNAINKNGCQILGNELKLHGDYYEIDFDDFEKKVKDPQVKLFILCSPHNPVSRVWSKEELVKIGQICMDNDVLVIADEVHGDLVYSGNKHMMFASLKEEFAMNSITCTAPSKTFNLTGLLSSNIIIPNPELRQRFENVLDRNGIHYQNIIGISALEAAYNEGEEWLTQLLVYLEGNIKFIETYLSVNLPKAKLIKPQGTYLGWIDLRKYEVDGRKLEKAIVQNGKVALDGGTRFGEAGSGFMRLNFACPRSLLEEGLKRLCYAVNNIE